MKFIETKAYTPSPTNSLLDTANGNWQLRRHYPFHFVITGKWTVDDFHRTLPEILEWCESTVKRRKLWHHEGIRIMFREERDAFAFKMRWC